MPSYHILARECGRGIEPGSERQPQPQERGVQSQSIPRSGRQSIIGDQLISIGPLL